MASTSATNNNNNKSFLQREVKFLNDGSGKKVLVSGIILAIATGLGAWGGFPDPPSWFNKFINTKMAQYSLVFVLIYQGGSSQNWKLALAITSILYILSNIEK